MKPATHAWPGLLLVLLFGLALSGCAGHGAAPPPAQALPSPDCLWVLWVKDPALMQAAQDHLAAGRSFALVVRETARQGGDQARFSEGCQPQGDQAHAVVMAGAALSLGQVSKPIELRGGQALVMRSTQGHLLAARSLLADNRYKEAAEEAAQDLVLDPGRLESWLLLGRARQGRGDLAGALKAYDQGLLLAPQDPDLLQAKAQALGEQGLAEGSQEFLDQALARDPDNPRLLAALALVMAREGRDLERAQDMASRAAKTDPNLAAAWLALGQAQRARGHHAEAVLAFHRAAVLEPGDQEARNGLRQSFMDLDPASLNRPSGLPPAPAKSPAKAPATPIAPPAPVAPTAARLAPEPAPPVAAAPSPAAARAATARPPQGHHYVQVASYRDKASAQADARSWRGKGHGAVVSAWKSSDGKTWYRVLLGPYGQRSRAQAAAHQLKSQKDISFYILVESSAP